MNEIRTGNTISAGGVVINARGEVLVVNQRGNSWSLPKGHLDPGEDLLTAARREIHEESGVDELNLIADLGSYQRPRISKTGGDDPTEMKTLHFFLFTTNLTTLAPTDHKHHPEARWMTLEMAAELLTHPKDRDFIVRMTPVIRQKLSHA